MPSPNGSLREIKRAVVRACRDKLGGLGWMFLAQTDSVQFTMQRSADVSYELGFGLARMTTLGLLPSIGVRHAEISDLSAAFCGLPPSRVCAFGRGLEDLLIADDIKWPSLRWRPTSLEDIDLATDHLRDDVRTYGSAFVQPDATLADVIRGLEQQQHRDQPQSGSLAIGRALAGDMAGAMVALVEYAAPAHRIFPSHSPQFRGFLRGFVDHFEVDQQSLPTEIAQYF